jgi:hypothetical protein
LVVKDCHVAAVGELNRVTPHALSARRPTESAKRLTPASAIGRVGDSPGQRVVAVTGV